MNAKMALMLGSAAIIGTGIKYLAATVAEKFFQPSPTTKEQIELIAFVASSTFAYFQFMHIDKRISATEKANYYLRMQIKDLKNDKSELIKHSKEIVLKIMNLKKINPLLLVSAFNKEFSILPTALLKLLNFDPISG